MTPLTLVALVLAVGALAGWALGNDARVSVGLWVALVATFALGRSVGREEERDAASPRAE